MEEFGVLSLLLTLSAFLMYIFTLGSFQFLFKQVNASSEERRSAFWASLIITATIGLLSTLIAFIFSERLAEALNLQAYSRELQLTILATASTSIMMIFLFYHYGLGRNNFQNFLQFLRGSLWVILAILISFIVNPSLLQIFVVINLSMCFILLISVPWKEMTDLFSHSIKKTSFKKAIKYCVPLLPYFAGVWGIPMIIRTQLNVYEGAANVAVFSVAYTLMEIVFMFISTITGTLSPYFFAETDDSDKPKLLYNIMIKYSIICIVLIVPFIYITRFDLILILTSAKYLIAGEYIPILIFFPLLRVIIIIFEQVYLKESKTIFLGVVYTISLLIAFLLALLLIPKFSILGAIVASIASYLFTFVSLYIPQRKKINFDYLNLPSIGILSALLWLAVYVLHFFEFHSFIKIFPLLIIALIALFLLPVFNEQEKNKILVLLKIKK